MQPLRTHLRVKVRSRSALWTEWALSYYVSTELPWLWLHPSNRKLLRSWNEKTESRELSPWCKDKYALLTHLCSTLGVSKTKSPMWETILMTLRDCMPQALYLPDNAVVAVKAQADHVLKRKGGEGARARQLNLLLTGTNELWERSSSNCWNWL